MATSLDNCEIKSIIRVSNLTANCPFITNKEVIVKMSKSDNGGAKPISLYKFFSELTNDPEINSEKIRCVLEKNSLSPRTKARLEDWLREIEFWEEYARIYRNLEKARPYRSLSKTFKQLVSPRPDDVWLDLGCGPAGMSRLLWQKSRKTLNKIVAMDIVLEPAQKTLGQNPENAPTELVYGNIGEKLPFPDQYFDGIVANLVIPYVIDYEGKTGKEALTAVLKETFRVLKPKGQLVWSTPRKNVKFQWVFLASLPDMLNIYEYIVNKDFSRILQGTRILRHALQIQKKGKKGVYTFLSIRELNELLQKVGFVSVCWQKTFARQVLVNLSYKPEKSHP